MSIAQRASWYLEPEEATEMVRAQGDLRRLQEDLARYHHELARAKEQRAMNELYQRRLDAMVTSSSTRQIIPTWLKITNTTT